MKLNSLLFFHCFIIIYSSYKISGNNANEKRCWLHTYGRGVGRPLSKCRSGQEKSGLLCYPKCKPGYYGVAFVCWQICPQNFADWGVTCAKPAPYGRGAGYALWDAGKCRRHHSQGCVQWGLLYYPRCADNFHQVGCCICSPDCPDGMHDAGAFCTKKTYTRTAGQPMTCEDDEEFDAALCYTKCKSGYTGVGPVCWGNCPKGYNKCGALCLEKSKCSQYFLKLGLDSKNVVNAADKSASGIGSGIAAGANVVQNLINPVC